MIVVGKLEYVQHMKCKFLSVLLPDQWCPMGLHSKAQTATRFSGNLSEGRFVFLAKGKGDGQQLLPIIHLCLQARVQEELSSWRARAGSVRKYVITSCLSSSPDNGPLLYCTKGKTFTYFYTETGDSSYRVIP